MDGVAHCVLEECGIRRGTVKISYILSNARRVNKAVWTCSLPVIDLDEAGFQSHSPIFGLADGPLRPNEWQIATQGPWLLFDHYKGYNIVLFDSQVFGFPLGYCPVYADPDLKHRPGVLWALRASELLAKIESITAEKSHR
jgi:hypothetical protein